MPGKFFKLLSLITTIVYFTINNVNCQSFNHPGLLHTDTSLVYIQQKIAAKVEPWNFAFGLFANTKWSDKNYEMMGPTSIFTRDGNIMADSGISYKQIMENDAYAIYCQSLMWKLTGDSVFADNAINMLNAWVSTLDTIVGGDLQLSAAFNGFIIVNGAELLRDYKKWNAADIENFKTWIRQVWYPPIKDIEVPGAHGNWDAADVKAVMAFALFLEDQSMFDDAINYFYNGAGNGTINHYFLDSGQNEESGRKQGYAQLGLTSFEEICEMAYNQGIDSLWLSRDSILIHAFEYAAKYNLGNEVDFQPMTDVYKRFNYTEISSDGRGYFKPIYRMAYNHFHNRLGADMPYTLEAINERISFEQTHNTVTDGVGWGTLFFYHPPEGEKPIVGDSVGKLDFEFDVLDNWNPNWGTSSNVICDGRYLNISNNSGPLNAKRGDIILNALSYPYVALKMQQMPNGIPSDWSLKCYFPLSGENNDWNYPAPEAVKKGDVYVFEWNTQKSIQFDSAFPKRIIGAGYLYLLFGNCSNGAVAKVDWIRSYKTIDEVPAEYALSNEATLESISVSEGSLTPMFSTDVFEYSDSLSTVIKSVTIDAVATDINATIKGTGSIDLSSGSVSSSIIVTAEDSVTKKTYTIDFIVGTTEVSAIEEQAEILNDIGVYTKGSTLIIDNVPEQSVVKIFDINGTLLFSGLSTNSSLNYTVNTGLYIVNIINSDVSQTYKVYIK